MVHGAAAGEADTPELDKLITPPLLNMPGPDEFSCCCHVCVAEKLQPRM